MPEWHSLTKSRASVGGLTCTRLDATAPDALAALPVPTGRGLLLVAQTPRDPQVGVRVRRFAADFVSENVPAAPGILDHPGSAAVIRFPRDLSEVGWWVRLEFSAPVGLCLTRLGWEDGRSKAIVSVPAGVAQLVRAAES